MVHTFKAEACEGANFDEQFYEEVKKFKLELEQQFTEAEHVSDENSNPMLNATISVEEVIKAQSNCKNGKACGEDSLPYEVFKMKAHTICSPNCSTNVLHLG